MLDHLNKLFDGATEDELLDCIKLLSAGIAEHREKLKIISIRHSMERLQSSDGNEEQTSFADMSKDIASDALEAVRIMAAEAAKAALLAQSEGTDESSEDLSTQEKRSQLRVGVAAPIEVVWPGDETPTSAELMDISWGGAAFHTSLAKAHPGDFLLLKVPNIRGEVITIETEVLRRWELPNSDGHGLATRFSSLSTHDEAELESILEFLANSADRKGQRTDARLTHRLDIQFDEDEEWQATLKDISAGGMAIQVPNQLQIGQSLQVVLSTMDESKVLKLRARVVRQEHLKMSSFDVYQVGLKFEHPPAELRSQMYKIISEMTSAKIEK